jgi:hypothetical protein
VEADRRVGRFSISITRLLCSRPYKAPSSFVWMLCCRIDARGWVISPLSQMENQGFCNNVMVKTSQIVVTIMGTLIVVRPKTKSCLALLVVIAFSLGASACQSTSKGASSESRPYSDTSATTPSRLRPRAGINDSNDGDDSPNIKNYNENNDDIEVEGYGHAANATDRRAVVDVARRFLMAAAADDGLTACSTVIARLVKEVPQRYGRPPNPGYLRGATCAEVMTKLLAHSHHQWALEASDFEVTAVRVTSTTAFALLKFAKLPERRYIAMEREGETWKLNGLLDSSFP